MITSDDLKARLEKLAQQHLVPGAAAAVLHDGRVLTAVTGVGNTTTEAAVRPDTLFAAGSVTKVFTAALVMTLLDEGLVELDAPVKEYLSGFALADAEKASAITIRMLLCHGAGLPATFFPDVAEGPNLLADYVAALKEVPVVGTPGRRWSYSNPGMVILGRLAEILTGLSYDEALEARVLAPLGANATADLNELILRSVAAGHFADAATGSVDRAPMLRAWPSNGPAGATLWCDVETFIAFAQMHLADGVSSNGQRVLSSRSVQAMQEPQYGEFWGVPGCDNWGLGWELFGTGRTRVATHSGGNVGMHSFLAVVPEQHGAVALLTNSTSGHLLNSELSAQLLAEVFGVQAPAPLGAPEQAVQIGDLDRFLGVYRSAAGTVTVDLCGEGLRLLNQPESSLAGAQTATGIDGLIPEPVPLTCVDADRARFVAQAEPGSVSGAWVPVEFSEEDATGKATLVRVGMLYERS